MTDLNALIPAGSPLFLMEACSINSRGEIVGLAQTTTGELHGYLLIPTPSKTGNGVRRYERTIYQ